MTCYEHLRNEFEDQKTRKQRIQDIITTIDKANNIVELDRNVKCYHKKHGRDID